MQENFFFQIFVYLAAAVISVPLAKRLGLGSVLGYLIAGIVIGPFALGLVGEEGQDVMHFAEFGVVMMLFLIGLELQPALLWKMRTPILGFGGLQVGISAILIMIICMLAGLSWQVSLTIGLTLALSSTAIVLQTLTEKGLVRTVGGKNVFSVLLFQDIAVIPILAIIPLLAAGPVMGPAGHAAESDPTWIEGMSIWARTLVVLGVITAIVLAGKYLVSPMFRIIAKTRLREAFTAAALFLVVGIALLMMQVGLSPALGTFLAGVILAQSEFRHELETDLEPFKGLLLGLFFISVGASIDFGLILDNSWLIIELVMALIVLKFMVLFIVGRIFRMGLDNNLLFAFSLAQGGEFAFVLFSFAVQSGVMENSMANQLISVVVISMALTPLIMLFNEKLIQPNFGTKKKVEREEDVIEEKNKVIIAGFGRMGSVIGRFLQANGIQATYLDDDPDNVDFLRRLGFKVYYGDASRHNLLRTAGAQDAEILIIAVNDPHKSLEMARTAQEYFPHLKILSRSNEWRDAFEMMDIGVKKVYRETFDTALQIGSDTLNMLGFRAYQVNRRAKKFKRIDERALSELARVRHDHTNYFEEVKQRYEDLEKLMLMELEDFQKDEDHDWDPATLIQESKGKTEN
jgi:CPA2 family monovalent cation:H+ antiporter-2/glutathione-regulated potassium-efflux system ancillary protein KefC/glutathione-regulated potassium-efflux system protein KefB